MCVCGCSGAGIPRLLRSVLVDNYLQIVTNDCGESIETLCRDHKITLDQLTDARDKAINILKSIHQCGWAHGDVAG
jgi:hypothetical protein